MSVDDASGQPPAPKPAAAATFTSFINKNTTGKRFAPKAARRRPGATTTAATTTTTATTATAAAAAPTPTPSSSAAAPETPAPAAESQTSHTEPDTSHAPATEALNIPPLPTPAATQEPPAETQAQADSEPHVAIHSSTDPGLTTQYLEDTDTGGRSPKRRRIEEPEVEATVSTPAPANGGGDHNIDPNLEAATADAQALPQPRKRRNLPWAAVNHPPEGEDEAIAAAPTRKPRQPRGKKNVTADPDADHVAQEDQDDEEAQPTRKRPAAKPRAKKTATETTTQDGEEVPAPPNKAKKPRKPRGALSSEVVQGTEDEVGRIADEIVAAAVRRKPKAKRRRKATPDGDDLDGIEGEESIRKETKRKGRPPREPTPSDAEDQTIDPDVTYMDSLAARTVRIGKLSALEKQMRTIDWEAVKQRRREEDNKKVISREEQEKADAALAAAGAELAAAQVEHGPRLRLNADGVMELVPDSGVIDREGDADRIINEMVITEDQDITARLTTRSFMKNNKRFPNEFLLPGQGRRWNNELTDRFYDALRSFGTDFQMISQMFPGFTRRSIKTKFTREERENPDGIRAALQGQCEINAGGWDKFLRDSEKTEESFADADKIKRELAEHEAEMREKIAAAQAEAQERKRQREIAGVDADGNPLGDGTNKENGKGKKKRGKNKQVAFQEEQGVEIIGEIGDDDTWGRE